MNKATKNSIAAIAAVYIGLTIFPIKAVYKTDKLKNKPFDPKTTQLFQVGKKIILLPGPKTIWAIRTPSGFDFYRGLPSPKKKNKPLFTSNDK
ncbi:MAG: hypothetical protein OCC45_07710 [Desulfotalea sp.]